MRVQPPPVVILNLHSECFSPLLDCPANSTHSQDTEDLSLWVMSKRDTLAPLPTAKKAHATIEPTEGSENEKYIDVRSGVVYGGGDIRDADSTLGARIDIDLVVASS